MPEDYSALGRHLINCQDSSHIESEDVEMLLDAPHYVPPAFGSLSVLSYLGNTAPSSVD